MNNKSSKSATFAAASLGVMLAMGAHSAGAQDAAPIGGEILFYDTSGGVVYQAEAETIFKDFTDATGVGVVDDYNDAATKFFASAQAGSMPWSLVLFPTKNDAAVAASEGLLQEIDTSIVPVGDLADGTYDAHGIEVGTFGMVLAWDDAAYPDKKPAKMADLWDTATFPGKRCFFNNPQYGWTLEAALLADGVAPADLYPLDVDRALAKLDAIAGDITWWSSGGQSIESFENGSCDIGILWANRAFTARKENGFPMNITWNEAGYSNSVWAIPADAPNAAAAQALIAHVVRNVDGQIAFASRVPTPIPASLKALSPSDFPADVQAFLPVGSNVEGSIAQNTDYYLENLDAILDRFNRWVSK